MVNSKPFSDSDVRTTDISVRSALIRVRCNDIPVRRDESSTEMTSEGDFAVTRVSVGSFIDVSTDYRWTSVALRGTGLSAYSISRSRK